MICFLCNHLVNSKVPVTGMECFDDDSYYTTWCMQTFQDLGQQTGQGDRLLKGIAKERQKGYQNMSGKKTTFGIFLVRRVQFLTQYKPGKATVLPCSWRSVPEALPGHTSDRGAAGIDGLCQGPSPAHAHRAPSGGRSI